MKKISITLSVVILCFLGFEIFQIQAVSYQLDSPLVSGSTAEDINHPYIILAIAQGLILLVLIALYIKSLFKISTIIAAVTIITTVVINYFCLLCG